jgi:amino acid permease
MNGMMRNHYIMIYSFDRAMIAFIPNSFFCSLYGVFARVLGFSGFDAWEHPVASILLFSRAHQVNGAIRRHLGVCRQIAVISPCPNKFLMKDESQ